MDSFGPSIHVTSTDNWISKSSGPYLGGERVSRRRSRTLSSDSISDLHSLERGDQEKESNPGKSLHCDEKISFLSQQNRLSRRRNLNTYVASLSRAHKLHVDRIMENLRIEMDALRDVDELLECSGCLSEDEVLDYFENVGLCLDHRANFDQSWRTSLERCVYSM